MTKLNGSLPRFFVVFHYPARQTATSLVMDVLFYILVFFGSLLVDIIPFIGPPAWTIMLLLQLKFGLNIWLVLLLGVSGSALGRYIYSNYIRRLSGHFIRPEKTDDLQFLGEKLKERGWRMQLFALLYFLIPIPTTPLFTTTGIAHISTLQVMPAFFMGKMISNGLMVSSGKFVAANFTAIMQGVLTLKNVLALFITFGLLLLFFFIDWHALLLDKKLRFRFRIWK